MNLFQNQVLIRVILALLGLLFVWAGLRFVFKWAARLSRLGCMAIVAIVIVVALLSSLR
ncbi:MAG TPA: hypothetical protein VK449_10540 [Anaerolineales bacterium]|nr:hypothetical protein [Anaerolineales bacterium]